MGKYEANREHFRIDVMNLMVPIEGGTVELRDYINTNKWLSSDYTLSDPGRGTDRKVITWSEAIESFYVMKYPVTRHLYHFVMHGEALEPDVKNLPLWRIVFLLNTLVSLNFERFSFPSIQTSDGTGL